MVETKQSFALEKRLQDLYDAHTERSKLIEWNYYDYFIRGKK